jgi:hypothetical protein
MNAIKTQSNPFFFQLDLKFFVSLAISRNFHPLDAEKWYSITHKDIVQAVSSCLYDQYNLYLFVFYREANLQSNTMAVMLQH